MDQYWGVVRIWCKPCTPALLLIPDRAHPKKNWADLIRYEHSSGGCRVDAVHPVCLGNRALHEDAMQVVFGVHVLGVAHFTKPL